MNEQTTKAFRDVLDKFVHIGNCYYNGKHHDNVLNIFSDLDEEDRKLLLRSVHHIYTIVEFGTTPTPFTTRLKAGPENDPVTIADYNTKLMVEMKFWFVKTFGILFLLSVTAFTFFILYVSSSGTGDTQRVANLFKIFGLLFD